MRDDCVLFLNSVKAMQAIVSIFDSLATEFGMEVSIEKTKVICNHTSKVEYKNYLPPEEVQHLTRSRSQDDGNKTDSIFPQLSIRGRNIEVVSNFKYLGNEYGSLENIVRARIIRMEYRFKQFEGRVLRNRHIGVGPRMNVFKQS